MKFFIDTADVNEIREAHALGLVDGVTTNPSLIAKSGRKFKDVIKEITAIVDGPISAEVISLEADGMVKEAKDLVKIHKNIVIKLPMTPEGLKACKTPDGKRDQDKRYPDLYADAGTAGSQGRRNLCFSLCWPPGRHFPGWHGDH